MTTEEAALLVTMHYSLTLLIIGRRYFFSTQQVLWFIIGLIVNLTLILFTHNEFFVILYLPLYLLQWVFSSKHMNSKVLPLIYLLLQYSISITTFYFTFDFQTHTHIGLVAPPVQLFILQMCLMLALLYVSLFFNKRYKLLDKLYFSKHSFKKTSVFLFILLLIMLISNTLISNSKYAYLSIVLVIIVFILLTATLLTTYLYAKFTRLTTDNAILRRTLQSEQDLYEYSREFQHDLKALLIGVDSYLSENKVEDARLLLKEVSSEGRGSIDQQYLSQLSAIENLPIKAAFYTFCATCTEQKIPFQLKIATDFKTISIELLDYLRCLSIMLNNAIEAATADIDHFSIQVEVTKLPTATVLRIKNPISKTFSIQSLFQKGYSSKSRHRGIGLSNLRKIVNKNKKAELRYSVKRGRLTAELILFD